jgi:hypothetical protein
VKASTTAKTRMPQPVARVSQLDQKRSCTIHKLLERLVPGTLRVTQFLTP